MEEPPLEDRELARAFLEGRDEGAFRELFRRHTPALQALTLRFLGRGARLSDDVIQETWLRAARGLSGFAWRSSLRTWLIGIAINCAREALRRERPFGASVGELPERAASGAPPDLDLERAIRELPDGYREVLVLKDIVGLTHEEIAERLGIEVGTSKSQLFRARRALRGSFCPVREEKDTS
jgi:RNA polymerase sigma-70 factor (ECF subfamily)